MIVRDVNPAWIVARVSEISDVPANLIYGRGRTQSVARARQEAMWMVRRWTALSLTEIARYFRRDRSTTIYGIRKVQGRLDGGDELTVRRVARIEDQIRATEEPSHPIRLAHRPLECDDRGTPILRIVPPSLEARRPGGGA